MLHSKTAFGGVRKRSACALKGLRMARLLAIVSVADLLASLRDDVRCSFLAAKTECQAESDSECYDQTGEKGLDEVACDAELVESGQETEDRDSPLRDRCEEVSRSHACGAGRTCDDLRDGVSDDDRDEEDEDCHDDLRQVEQYDALEEDVDLGEAEDFERSDEEGYDDEPLNEAADEGARVKVEARALHDASKACLLESCVELDGADKVSDEASNERADDPANDKDDDSCDQIRKKCGGACPDARESARYRVSPYLKCHNE